MQDGQPDVYRRKSNGLSHFFGANTAQSYRAILDLGGLSQETCAFLGRFDCTIHAFDLLADFDHCKQTLPDGELDAAAAEKFVQRHLPFGPGQFDAILAWDALEYLDSQLLELMVPRLSHILIPGGSLLTFFHTQSRGEVVPVYRYLIEDSNVLKLRLRRERTLPQTFSTRRIEGLFSGFRYVKFFLTRDLLREVVAVR